MYVVFAPYSIQEIDEIRKTSNRWQQINIPWETGKSVTLLFNDGYLMEDWKGGYKLAKLKYVDSIIAWRYERDKLV
jgi:hypothetical protein